MLERGGRARLGWKRRTRSAAALLTMWALALLGPVALAACKQEMTQQRRYDNEREEASHEDT